MSANNACCVIRYTAVGKAAVVLTSIVSVYAFLQIMAQNWCEISEWRTFLLLVITLSSGYAAGVLCYGVTKETPSLLTVYSCMCVAISPLCLLTEVYSRHSETCSPNVVGMTISFLLLLLLAGIVWRCRLIMVKVTSTTNSAPESPPAVTESSTSTDGDRIGDDPPSYRDVAHRPPPEESSSVFTVPLPHESYKPFSYGSLNTLPPAYHLAVSQMSYETNTSPSDVILRPSDITLPSQAPAAGNLTTLFNSSESPQSAIHVQNTWL